MYWPCKHNDSHWEKLGADSLILLLGLFSLIIILNLYILYKTCYECYQILDFQIVLGNSDVHWGETSSI